MDASIAAGTVQAARVVVIGYGSILRGDDAVGPRVAAAVAGWRRSGVGGLSVHQLTPELASVLASAEVAIFVDAGRIDGAVRVDPVAPDAPVGVLAHSAGPTALLALTLAAYGRVPRAYAVTVPAASFGLGSRVSRAARRGIGAAIRAVDRLILESDGAPRA